MTTVTESATRFRIISMGIAGTSRQPRPEAAFDGYYATAPENGGDAHLIGGEFDFSRRLDFVPGLPSGLGFDVNWTQVYSKAAVAKDTATTAATLGQPVIRDARLPRQSNSVGN